MVSYDEIEYVRWCRARAVERGAVPDSGLYTVIYRQDRRIFEEWWSDRERHRRQSSEPTELIDIGAST